MLNHNGTFSYSATEIKHARATIAGLATNAAYSVRSRLLARIRSIIQSNPTASAAIKNAITVIMSSDPPQKEAPAFRVAGTLLGLRRKPNGHNFTVLPFPIG
jgi:hypothetical protein